MSDSFHFDIAGAPLDESLKIAFRGASGRKVTHWFIEERERPLRARLLLAWHENAGSEFNKLFTPLDHEQAEGFIKAWLESIDYGVEPDHDGNNGKGWRVYNESWAHVDTNHYVFAAIEPHWNMYGK